MAYNRLRFTVSKFNCHCDICKGEIKVNDSIAIIPGKYVAHSKCHLKKHGKKM